MNVLRTCCIALAITFSASPYANDFDLRISDDALHTQLTLSEYDSALRYGMGYFYKDADQSVNVFNVDLHSKGQTVVGNLPASVGVGVEANYLKVGDIKGSAIGLGGSLRLNIPETPGLSLETAAHFAPDVLAFEDAKRYFRGRTQVNYRVIETADLSVGYRYQNVKLIDGQKRTLESGLFVGLKLNF